MGKYRPYRWNIVPGRLVWKGEGYAWVIRHATRTIDLSGRLDAAGLAAAVREATARLAGLPVAPFRPPPPPTIRVGRRSYRVRFEPLDMWVRLPDGTPERTDFLVDDDDRTLTAWAGLTAVQFMWHVQRAAGPVRRRKGAAHA